MRPPGFWGDPGDMNEPTVVITLELRAEEDSISGRASVADGCEREFAGWVGLIAVLDDLVPAAAAPTGS